MRKIFISVCLLALAATGMSAGTQLKEKLNRAPVAVMTKTGVLVSWRSLTTDPAGLTFDVYRNGSLVAQDIADRTNFLDVDGEPGATYSVVTSDGERSEIKAWDSMYKKISVNRPPATKDASGGLTGRYRPDDISVGDVDGDGEYELFIKWLPDNARDSGKEGKASPTYLTCNRMDGTELWRMNFGHNIRSGNHTMQFIVYDFDGDGKAEMICRTAAGTTDGTGKYVSEASDDAAIKATNNATTYQNSKGYVTGGEEFLTVFNGETGKAMHTVWYWPNRGGGIDGSVGSLSNGYYGDTYSGRAERFNAAVAYLDGLDKLPSAILQRGYYARCAIWAVDWDGTSLKTRWLHRGTSKTEWEVVDANGKQITSGSGKSSFGQGVHGISVGDITGDGCDDICIGAASIDSKGRLLCSTGMGHGDAIHLADLVPSRPGLEVMMPHEETPYGYDVHDALTGEILASATGTEDNGRGIAGNFIPANENSVFWSQKYSGSFDCGTGEATGAKSDTNFRIYWNGDPYDQTFDGHYDATTGCAPSVKIWNTATKKFVTFQEFKEYGSPQTVNTTKATPCLQADLMGDWREELILLEYEADWSAKTCQLMIFSTPEPTDYKVPCLMEDHLYRMGIAWQNSSYNQPPHLGYNLPAYLGIDGKTYTTNTVNNAPSATGGVESPSGEETVKNPSNDKEVVKGICYTAGEYGEYTASTSGNYIKVRTNNNGETITYTVNPGYVITKMYIEGYSNNTSTIADRSITMTSVAVDGTEMAESSLVFPGGTAGQTPVSRTYSNLGAKQNIVLNFDNSNITTSDVDAAGKNKQIMVKVIFTYEQVPTGISEIVTSDARVSDAVYNLAGQRVSEGTKGIVIKNGKKIFVK